MSKVEALKARLGEATMMRGVKSRSKRKKERKVRRISFTSKMLKRTVFDKRNTKKTKIELAFDELADDEMSSNDELFNKSFCDKAKTAKPIKSRNKSPKKRNKRNRKRKKMKWDQEQKMMEVVSKEDDIVKIRCFAPLNEYISSKRGKYGKGLIIERFECNEYGKKMKASGIKIGWILTRMDKHKVINKSYNFIKKKLKMIAKIYQKDGYELTFQRPKEKKMKPDAVKDDTCTDTTSDVVKSPKLDHFDGYFNDYADEMDVENLKLTMTKEELEIMKDHFPDKNPTKFAVYEAAEDDDKKHKQKFFIRIAIVVVLVAVLGFCNPHEWSCWKYLYQLYEKVLSLVF